jgi:hypothetical protein
MALVVIMAIAQMLTARLSEHQVVINGHALWLPLSFVRSCDLCRPGTAVQARVPQLRWRIVRAILGVTCGNVGLHAHTACI